MIVYPGKVNNYNAQKNGGARGNSSTTRGFNRSKSMGDIMVCSCPSSREFKTQWGLRFEDEEEEEEDERDGNREGGANQKPTLKRLGSGLDLSRQTTGDHHHLHHHNRHQSQSQSQNSPIRSPSLVSPSSPSDSFSSSSSYSSINSWNNSLYFSSSKTSPNPSNASTSLTIKSLPTTPILTNLYDRGDFNYQRSHSKDVNLQPRSNPVSINYSNKKNTDSSPSSYVFPPKNLENKDYLIVNDGKKSRIISLEGRGLSQPREEGRVELTKLNNQRNKLRRKLSSNVHFLEPFSPLEDDKIDSLILKLLVSQDRFGIFCFCETIFEFPLKILFLPHKNDDRGSDKRENGISNSKKKAYQRKNCLDYSSPYSRYRKKKTGSKKSILKGNNDKESLKNRSSKAEEAEACDGDEDEDEDEDDGEKKEEEGICLNRLIDQFEPKELNRARLDPTLYHYTNNESKTQQHNKRTNLDDDYDDCNKIAIEGDGVKRFKNSEIKKRFSLSLIKDLISFDFYDDDDDDDDDDHCYGYENSEDSISVSQKNDQKFIIGRIDYIWLSIGKSLTFL